MIYVQTTNKSQDRFFDLFTVCSVFAERKDHALYETI